jgi:hypothetical protein
MCSLTPKAENTLTIVEALAHGGGSKRTLGSLLGEDLV